MTTELPQLLQRFRPCVSGDGDTTVVLGHGIGTDQTAWSRQVQALTQAGYRTVVFDFAGATVETQQYFSPTHHKTLYGLAEDLLVVVHGLGIERPIYMGHSMGAMAGVLAALAEPQTFQALILLGASMRYLDDPATGYVGGFSTEQMDLLLRSAQDNYAQWANGFAPAMVGAANPHLSAEAFTQQLLSLRPDIVHTILSAALLSDHRADMRQLLTPCYVIQTVLDNAVPRTAARALAELGRARRYTEIPTQGHLPHITAPDVVNQVLLNCLRDLHQHA